MRNALLVGLALGFLIGYAVRINQVNSTITYDL